MEGLYMDDLGKIEDAGAVVRGGGIDRHWQTIAPEREFFAMFGEKRKDPWLFDSNLVLDHFNLRSIEFGNWMTQQDRSNFLYASALSLHHLAQILKIDDADIGMGGRLSLALGARGSGQASAHYESTPYAVINLTKTQGFGALAHEYAHAIDNIISFLTKSRETFVSGGRETRKGYDPKIVKNGNFFEQQFEEFYNLLYFNKKGEETQFSKDISGYNAGDYYERRNEVFARSFEVYVFNLLKDANIKNTFLVSSSYKDRIYPNEKLSKLVKPIIDRIVKKGYAEIRKNKQTLQGVGTSTGYKGFRTTLKENANLDDTLQAMKLIALRDYRQVEGLAFQLKTDNVRETSENIWNYLRENTRYKLDRKGIEELRTPARSLVDGKKGLQDANFGIDCDDYTILVSALLLNLRIPHEYRVTAYEQVGRFQHIYPVAFDTDGTPYVIDIVPEIPHFNHEEQPIIDLKTIPMELHELSGAMPVTIEEDDFPITDEEILNDFAEEIDQANQLEGIDDDDTDMMLDTTFLSGFEEVLDEADADIVLQGTSDTVALLERGILAEVNKARQVLANEKRQPTVLSQLVNVPQELRIIDTVMQSWNDEQLRDSALMAAMRSDSQYVNFFRAIKTSLDQLSNEQLNGIDDEELDEPLYLARIPNNEDLLLDVLEDEDDDLEGLGMIDDDELYDDDFEDMDDLGMIDDEYIDDEETYDFDEEAQNLSGFFRKAFRKIRRGVKKAVKAVVRFNPATLAMRSAITLVLKLNMFKFSEKLIYGYLTEAQARQQGLNLNEWRKRVSKLRKAERFFTKIGGRASKFRKAIVRGKAAKRTRLPLSGLGAVATTTVAPASGFIVFMKRLLSKLNPIKAIKKGITKIKNKIRTRGQRKGQQRVARRNARMQQPVQQRSIPRRTAPTRVNTFVPNPQNTTTVVNTNLPTIQNPSFLDKVKRVFTKHKKKWIVGIAVTLFAIVGVTYYKKNQQKKKRSLAGIKAARTRAKNRKQLTAAPRRRTTTKRSTAVQRKTSTPKRRTPRALPARAVSGTRKRKTSNGSRLKAMHRKAKQLQKTHPKTKYSTLLKRAAKTI